MENFLEYDVAVVGAGHVGIEASSASSRLGLRVVIILIWFLSKFCAKK